MVPRQRVLVNFVAHSGERERIVGYAELALAMQSQVVEDGRTMHEFPLDLL